MFLTFTRNPSFAVSNILTFDNSDDLQILADTILDDAVKKSSRSDDVSIGVIRVKEI